MKTKQLEQARYIFANGRHLHEHILQIQAKFLGAQQKGRAGDDLTLSQLHAVKTIHQLGPVSISQLAKSLKVSLPSVSVMVDRLVEKGVLTRTRSTIDRRKVEVSIVPHLQEDIKKLELAILETFIDLVEKIGPETTQKWCDVLEKVGQALTGKRQQP